MITIKPFVFLFSMLVFIALAEAQEVDIMTSRYDLIQSKKFVETGQSLNLFGEIKKVTHVFIESNDTSSMSFDQDGYLTHYIYEPLDQVGNKPTRETFKYDAKHQLKELMINQVKEDCEVVRYFNTDGYLIKETETCSETDFVYDHEAYYSYNSDYTEMEVEHNYRDLGNWDLIRRENYIFSFNERGDLTHEKSTVKYSESTYGSQQHFTYDPVTNLPISIWYRADCAGSNSCLDLHLSLEYDQNGRIKSETLIDATIRNSLWSYSYGKEFSYNRNGLLIEECISNHIGGILTPSTSSMEYSTCDPIKYSFDYDKQGNWVTKYMEKDDIKRVVEKRTIEYKK